MGGGKTGVSSVADGRTHDAAVAVRRHKAERVFDRPRPPVDPQDDFGAGVGSASPGFREIAVIALQNSYRAKIQMKDFELISQNASGFAVVAVNRRPEIRGRAAGRMALQVATQDIA